MKNVLIVLQILSIVLISVVIYLELNFHTVKKWSEGINKNPNDTVACMKLLLDEFSYDNSFWGDDYGFGHRILVIDNKKFLSEKLIKEFRRTMFVLNDKEIRLSYNTPNPIKHYMGLEIRDFQILEDSIIKINTDAKCLLNIDSHLYAPFCGFSQMFTIKHIGDQYEISPEERSIR